MCVIYTYMLLQCGLQKSSPPTKRVKKDEIFVLTSELLSSCQSNCISRGESTINYSYIPRKKYRSLINLQNSIMKNALVQRLSWGHLAIPKYEIQSKKSTFVSSYNHQSKFRRHQNRLEFMLPSIKHVHHPSSRHV